MTPVRQTPYLLNEPPLMVYRSLAEALGVNKAIVFQQLHLLINNQQVANNLYNLIDGRWWVYNSYQQWKTSYFPWLSNSTLKGIFNELEDAKLVLSMQSVKNKSDRRKWYTIDYDAWDAFIPTIGQKMPHQPSDKKSPMVGQKMSTGYSESPTDSFKESRKPTPSKKNEKEDALIDIWADVRGFVGKDIGADYHTDADRRAAKRMLKWSRPPTAEEIQLVMKVSKSTAYAFPWLEKDVQELRLERAKNPLPVRTEPTAAVDDGDEITPEQAAKAQEIFKQLVEAKSGNSRRK